MGKLNTADYECFPGVPAQALKTGWLIETLHVPEKERGRGLAKAALAELAREADQKKKWMFLHAYPLETKDFEEDRSRLQKLYESAGFIHHGSGWMARAPKPKKS